LKRLYSSITGVVVSNNPTRIVMALPYTTKRFTAEKSGFIIS